MQALIIKQTNETPDIELNAPNGTFSFIGKSFPENVNDFYGETLKYLELYVQQPQEKTILEFYWLYFNTATSKIIVKIIMLLKSVTKQGKAFEINWKCSKDDDLMIEKGEEFKELLGAGFSINYI
jgi:protein tyrosine phosphatase